MLVLTRPEVEELLDLDALVDSLAEAHRALSAGGVSMPARGIAAGSALATRLLARDDARVLAILGTGVQARSHARALVRVREFDEVRVAGRDAERVRGLAEELGARA